jgi:hypothetical protein
MVKVLESTNAHLTSMKTFTQVKCDVNMRPKGFVCLCERQKFIFLSKSIENFTCRGGLTVSSIVSSWKASRSALGSRQNITHFSHLQAL